MTATLDQILNTPACGRAHTLQSLLRHLLDSDPSLWKKTDHILIKIGKCPADGCASTDAPCPGAQDFPSLPGQIRTCRTRNKAVFLATQCLKNMETKPIPLIPEIIDLLSSIRQGISGVQLSEETAVGLYPVECIHLVWKLYHHFRAQLQDV